MSPSARSPGAGMRTAPCRLRHTDYAADLRCDVTLREWAWLPNVVARLLFPEAISTWILERVATSEHPLRPTGTSPKCRFRNL